MKALRTCLTALWTSTERVALISEIHWNSYWTEYVLQQPPPPFSTAEVCQLLRGNDIWDKYFAPAKGMKLFVTKRGYLGIGPKCLEDEDTLVVLCGGRVPYVFRTAREEHCGDRDDRGFQLLGDCYLDNLMHGEIGQMVDSNETELKCFVLY
jgi:hypothetical protein